ncbi:LPS assembly lipoprotein LptE [Celeribacter sp.]|uniref:LPS assembly lipoprotein LptE n=1 Tax=Celeribacter sp. TaxID=1890673 RepID=UPI003A95467F
MSSFNRRSFLMTATAFGGLAGCGFAPVYGPNGRASVLREAVELTAPDTREDYTFVRAVEAQLGAARTPRFKLDYKISTDEDSIGLTRDQEINRYHVTGEVDFTLTDQASGTVISSGKVTAFSAYSASESTFAALSATRDAYERLTVQLADKTVAKILAVVGTSG